MSERHMEIDGRRIAADTRPYVIAEISGNHNGQLSRALALIDAAKAAGADAVKLQTYTADTMTIRSDRPEFRLQGGLWSGRTLYELYEEASTPWDWHEAIFAHGRKLGITVFSTPFDESAVALLEKLEAPAYKIASFENTDLPLIERVARTGKPMIISTGMANMDELAEAIEIARGAGCRDLMLLHCVSAYPSDPADSNLLTIPELARRFDVSVGLSDHTLGTTVAVVATALGAAAIEKHVTLARADGGVDSAFSLEPAELKTLVETTRVAHAALGAPKFEACGAERGNLVYRRSLYVVQDVRAGEIFSTQNIRAIRPGYGLKPKHLKDVLGRRAARDIRRGDPVDWSMLA